MIILSLIPMDPSSTARVTVTLPAELVESIDRIEPNRSRFVAQAIERELARRQRAGLLRSLRSPHPEAMALAEAGLAEWGAGEPASDDLVDSSAGRSIRWVEGRGWVPGKR